MMVSVTRKTSCSSNESADVFQIGLDAHSPRQSDCQSDSASSTEVHGPSLLPSAGAVKEEQDSKSLFARGLVIPPTFLRFFCAEVLEKGLVDCCTYAGRCCVQLCTWQQHGQHKGDGFHSRIFSESRGAKSGSSPCCL